MKSEDFCNWLKGYLELANPAEIRAREIEVIREHLELVAKKKQISKNFIEEGEKSFQKMMRETNEQLEAKGLPQIYC